MRLSEKDPRQERLERERRAVLEERPLQPQAADPEADERLDRSDEGDDEPITEKVSADPSPRKPGQR